MPIFDQRIRTDLRVAQEGEPQFQYIDASGRPEAARIRALLNDFAMRYPLQHRNGLVDRIRDESQNSPAVFELLVHELCLKSGMTVVDVEPRIDGTSNRPDFLVESADGCRFYLECVVAHGETGREAGARRRREDVLNAINAIPSPDFFLAVEAEDAPSHPVRIAVLTRRIRYWISQLNYTSIVSDPETAPVFEEELSGMALSIRPIPKDSSRGEPGDRAIAMLGEGIRLVCPEDAMRRAVLKKAGRYGELDLPFVVALGANERDARLEHVMDVLYGTEAYVGSIGHEGRLERQRDGVWTGPRGPQCTRLSAVLALDRLGPWSLGQRDGLFVENFWAAHPAGHVDFKIDSWRRTGSNLIHRTGQRLRELFGVPAEWPETPGAHTDPI